VETNEQWKALREAMVGPQWAQDTRFDSAEGRLAAQDKLDAGISEWTKERGPYEVMEVLQKAGVPSGVAQRSSDLMNDPQLKHRGFHRYLDHPEMGNVPYSGHQFRIRGYDSAPLFAAPCLGQHSEQVMRDILAMSEQQMAEVLAAGALV
jgi:crotonobetainyl-CoA:carnitine CoA-transferase CaiB-like acyl-CoA transferase